MAMTIILTDDKGNQLKTIKANINKQSWEDDCFTLGCELAKELATQYLKELDDKLNKERNKDLSVKDIRERTILTRFGHITVRRRIYKNKQRKHHYLLDEYLNWRPNQQATPDLTSDLVDSAVKMSFRDACMEAEKYTAGVISASTVHCLLTRVTKDAISKEKKQHESWYEDGSIPPPGERKVSILYMEADGLWVHLQREKQKHYELKSAIAYEGWEHHPDDSYSLINKKVYCHGDDSIPFWQLSGIHFDKYWDLDSVKLIVLGGDDADWINAGESEMGYCVRQLDGFHLLRSCSKGWENGQEIYTSIRNGDIRNGDISKVIEKAKERIGKSCEKERRHVLRCLDRGMDWRKKVLEIPEEARGLGTMEGNESNLYSDRMKDRGMSWTIKGSQRMGKAIELSRNGELSNFVGRRPTLVRNVEESLNFDLFIYKDAYTEQASMPVLYGQYASRPWVRVLKELTSFDYPLN